MAQLMLFSGNATPELTKKVSDYLSVPVGNASVGRFSDGEIAVEIIEMFEDKTCLYCSQLAHQRTTT